MDPTADRAAAARGIQNVAQACTYCKSRHSKCDGQVPCSQCVRRGRGGDCSYSVVRKRGPKPKKDLYEYCNKLLVELEVQKQIADYWKGALVLSDFHLLVLISVYSDQFVMAMKGKEDGSLPPAVTPTLNSSAALAAALDPNRPKFSIERVPSPDDMDASDDLEVSPSDSTTRPSAVNSPTTSFSPAAIKVECPTPPPPGVSEDAPPIDPTVAADIALVFLDIMLPVIPELTFVPSPTYMCEVYNSSRSQFEAVATEDYHQLVALLESAVIGAFGARSSGHVGHMRHFAKKAEELMHVLFFQREVQTRADVANRLVGALVLLSSYYAGDEREGSKQSVIMLAYQIVSLHRKQIPAAAMFRIYNVMMGLADTQEDRVYWMEQSNAVVREASMDMVTAQTFGNLIYVLSSLHPKLIWGKGYPNFTSAEITALQEKLLMVDHFLAMIPSPREPTRVRNFYDAISTIKLMYIGARVELHFLRGEYDYAKRLIYAAAILGSTFHKPAIHTFMYGISGPVEVAMHLNMPINLLREFYITLEKLKDCMPGAVRLFNQVTDYIQRNDSQANRFFASAASLRQTVSDDQRLERNDKVHSLLQQCPVAVQNLTPAFLTHKSALEMFRPRLPGLVDATVMAMELLRRRIADEIAASISGGRHGSNKPASHQPVPHHGVAASAGSSAPSSFLSSMSGNMPAMMPAYPQLPQTSMYAASPQSSLYGQTNVGGFGFDQPMMQSTLSPGFQPMAFSGDISPLLNQGMPPHTPPMLSPNAALPPQGPYQQYSGQVDIENFFNSNVVSSEYDM